VRLRSRFAASVPQPPRSNGCTRTKAQRLKLEEGHGRAAPYRSRALSLGRYRYLRTHGHSAAASSH
jgi:hypothetical protein